MCLSLHELEPAACKISPERHMKEKQPKNQRTRRPGLQPAAPRLAAPRFPAEHEAMADPEPVPAPDAASPTATRLLGRLGYAATQGARVAWYTAHYALLRAMTRGGARQGDSPPPRPSAPPPDRTKVRAAFRALFNADRANIEAGLYPAPRDLDPTRLLATLRRSRAFFADARVVEERRRRRGGTEARALGSGRYPSYYLQNFHYQTDGWLSRRSARLYDTQVEVLFTGAADAMRRAALAELARALQGRDQRRVRLLDVACGAGRFLEQIMDAFPRLDATGVDLSPAYIEEAAERLASWPTARVLEANAESLPFENGSFDVVASIYLFHELPPRVRTLVAAEMARVVKPGGMVVFADSIQTGDDANLDRMLETFPHWFHEPYYASYLAEDLDALWTAAGLTKEREGLAFLTKVRTYRKPAA
jgi:ubiquinone/menaquinone biosynthesis C-methylase UbiE